MTKQQEAHEPSVNELVGELVHQHMWRGKVTQTSLAAHLGIAQPSIARKLRGERPFSIDELLAVAKYLNLPITALVPNAENPHQDGPGGGDTVRHQGLEPRTHWYGEKRRPSDVPAPVVPLFPAAPQTDDEAEVA